MKKTKTEIAYYNFHFKQKRVEQALQEGKTGNAGEKLEKPPWNKEEKGKVIFKMREKLLGLEEG